MEKKPPKKYEFFRFHQPFPNYDGHEEGDSQWVRNEYKDEKFEYTLQYLGLNGWEIKSIIKDKDDSGSKIYCYCMQRNSEHPDFGLVALPDSYFKEIKKLREQFEKNNFHK